MDTCAGTTETASVGNAINLISRKWLAVSCGNQLRTRKARSAVQLENRLRRIPGGDWRAGGFSALQVAGAMAKGEG